MKTLLKNLGLLVAVMFSVMLFQGKTIAQVPYGIFDETTGTLTLFYGQNLPDGAVEVKTSGLSWYSYIGTPLTNAEKVKKIVFDKSFADYLPTTCANWFYNCINLSEIDYLKNLRTDNVTDMSWMFGYCKKLTSLDVSNFKTDNVTDMHNMFIGCSKLTSLDVSNFKTDNVTDMSGIFIGCSSLTSLDVSNFKTDNVTNMDRMFDDCHRLTSLDVSNFKTDNVTNMGSMFIGCSRLTSLDVSNFKTDNVTDMSGMFCACSSLTSLDLSNFKTDNVTNMREMFCACSSLTSLDLSNFNTENIINMQGMFFECSSLTSLDVSNFKTDNVMNMHIMFSDCRSLKTIYVGEGWNTNAVNYGRDIFLRCNNLIGGKGTKWIGDDIKYAHIDGGEDNPGYFTAVVPILLSITNLPSKYEYVEGEPFSADGGVLTVTFNNGSTEDIALKSDDIKLSGFDNTKLGEQKLTVSYLGLETTFNVKVVAKSPVAVAIKTLPTSIEYIEGTEMSTDGGVLEISYNNGTRENITFNNENVKMTGFDNTKIGEQTLTVSYLGFETTFKVKVVAKSPVSVVIKTLPTSTEYIEGTEVSTDGGVLEISYNNGTRENSAFNNEKVKISGFDNTKLGEQKLTVSYLGLETTFNVKVVAKSPVSVAIKALPTKVEYVKGQDFSIDGGILTITFNNGTTEDIALKSDDIKISGFDKNKIGEQTVTIEYLGQTATFSVKVIEDSKTPVSELSASTCTVDVFPNPAKSNDEITIKISGSLDDKTSKILIYNSVGSIVKQIDNVTEYNRISLKSGVYTGVLITRNGKKSFRIVVN